MVPSTTTLPRMASPDGLCTKSVLNTTGLGSGAGVDALCTIPVTLSTRSRHRVAKKTPERAPRVRRRAANMEARTRYSCFSANFPRRAANLCARAGLCDETALRAGVSARVVEDDSERRPLPPRHRAHAMAQPNAVVALLPAARTLAGREDHKRPTPRIEDVGAALRARALLEQDELTAVVIDARLSEDGQYLEWKEDVPV